MSDLPPANNPSSATPLPEPLASLATPSVSEPGTDPVAAAPTVPRFYRHTLPVRLTHWLNVLCLPILVMSGLQIFNAHPRLYWGNRSDRDHALLSLQAVVTDSGALKGVSTVFGWTFETTGLFGVSGGVPRGFPAWATMPSGRWLAMGRRWHFFFAWLFTLNGLAFGLYALCGRHLWRHLWPTWQDVRGLGRTLLAHLLLRRPTGEAAKRYNVLQKLAYAGVVFVLGPLIVLTGLAMSPQIDASFPWLLTLFGGRQAARTIHFGVCFAFVGFTLVHLGMVTVTGLWNNLRSMVTGWYALPTGMRKT
jgi:thiosulfate reductase cytochrome b subunit